MKIRWTPMRAVLTIALTGIVGGASIFVAATQIGEDDRGAIAAWDATVGALLVEPRARAAELPALADAIGEDSARDRLVGVRVALQDIRDGLPGVSTPKILFGPTEDVTVWIGRSIEAVTVLEAVLIDDRRSLRPEEQAHFDRVMSEGEQHYIAAREAVLRLRCLSKLPDCEATNLPGCLTDLASAPSRDARGAHRIPVHADHSIDRGSCAPRLVVARHDRVGGSASRARHRPDDAGRLAPVLRCIDARAHPVAARQPRRGARPHDALRRTERQPPR